MNNKVHYIILENEIILSKKEYNNWREIQDEYYENFKACIGPWTYEELISYLEDDFKEEDKWPFIKENIIKFFNSQEIIKYSDR
jgi:hypothetical protein